MLLQVLDFIKQQGMVNTQQLTRHFKIDEQALQPMLELWVKKGMIRPCQQAIHCQSSCFKCRINAPGYYEPVMLDS